MDWVVVFEPDLMGGVHFLLVRTLHGPSCNDGLTAGIVDSGEQGGV